MPVPTREQIIDLAKRIEAERIHQPSRSELPRITIEVEFGTRYARLVRSQGSLERSAYGFVDLNNGDLLKAAGWKTPAKHARGNMFNPDPLVGCTQYGMVYLR